MKARKLPRKGIFGFGGCCPASAPHSLYGWNGSLEVKVLPVLAIVADFSGHYGKETIGSLLLCRGGGPPPFASPCTENESASLYTLTFGPQVSLLLIDAGAFVESALIRIVPAPDTREQIEAEFVEDLKKADATLVLKS